MLRMVDQAEEGSQAGPCGALALAEAQKIQEMNLILTIMETPGFLIHEKKKEKSSWIDGIFSI